MRTRPIVNAFIGAAGMWGVKTPGSSLPSLGLRAPRTVTGRTSGLARMSVDPAMLEAGITSELMAQLAGCAALVTSGKALQVLLPEEHEPEFHHEWQAKKAEGEVDLYRDTWVRYFGYFNEVGEAMRPLIPAFVVSLSYVVAFVYIGADSYSQGAKVLSGPKKDTVGLPSILAAVDSLLFQGLASVVFPSFTINRWVTFASIMIHQLHDKVEDLPSYVDYAPTITGLFLIPLICSPLDTLTHKLLDVTYRPATVAVSAAFASGPTNSSPPFASSFNTTRNN